MRQLRRFTSYPAQALLALALCCTLAQAQSNPRPPANQTPLQQATQRFQSEAAQAEADISRGRKLLNQLGARAPATLSNRQKAAETALQARYTQLGTWLSEANGTSATAQRSSDAFLQAMQPKPGRSDSEEPPVQAVRKPLAELRSANASNRIAPEPADLAATLDAPITTAITAQASQLGQQPVAIFEWVRKNIAFVPSTGSLQGAQGTLESKRGNATDTASLLIAMLRASNIPARYVRGQVSLSAQQLKRWLGVDSIEAVARQ